MTDTKTPLNRDNVARVTVRLVQRDRHLGEWEIQAGNGDTITIDIDTSDDDLDACVQEVLERKA